MKRHAEQSIPQDGKCIRYDRETGDYACYLNGEFIGYAANYGAGVQLCNEVYYAQLTHASAPPEPAPSPEPPPPDPWPLVARAPIEDVRAAYAQGFDQGFAAALDLICDKLQARKAELAA